MKTTVHFALSTGRQRERYIN